MLRIVSVLSIAALAGCTSLQASEDAALRVRQVDDYYWPQAVAGPAQRAETIDVFPLVTALLVERRDGRPLGLDDEAASRAAARAVCAARGERHGEAALSRLQEGTWAFSTCEAVSD